MELFVLIITSLLPTVTFGAVPILWTRARSPLQLPVYTRFMSVLGQSLSAKNEADSGRFASQVVIFSYPEETLAKGVEPIDQNFIASGSIISTRFIITVAHCLYKMSHAAIKAGTTDYLNEIPTWEGNVTSDKFIIHQNFDPVNLLFDIALIDAERITCSKFVVPVHLPNDVESRESFMDMTGSIAGWGGQADVGQKCSRLESVQSRINSGSKCTEFFGNKFVDSQSLCVDMEDKKLSCLG